MSKFIYAIDFKEATFESDKPYIRGVVLLGSESKNKRRYTQDCMKQAVGLYENVQAFVNHPTQEEQRSGLRDVMQLAGKFENCRFESNKIKADFHGLPNDPASQKFVNIAENMPEIAGMSQHASGKVRREDGVEVVESILAIHSIDLVAKPATTNGFFENEYEKTRDEIMTQEKLTEIAEDLKGGYHGDDMLIATEDRATEGDVQESDAKAIAESLKSDGFGPPSRVTIFDCEGI